MSQTLDTNILVYASNDDAPEQPRAVALLEHLVAGPELVLLLWPTVLGYLRLATHPSICARPLAHDAAVANIDALLELPHIRVAGEVEGFWSAYRSTASEIRAKGNLVPDAHLVALMRQHGINRIWSRDRDLRRFDGINALDPFDARWANGFIGPPRGR